MAIISVNGLNDNTIDQGRMYMVLVNIFTSIFRQFGTLTLLPAELVIGQTLT